MVAFPVVTVEAALPSAPLAASPTYIDVSEGFRWAKGRRGRSHELDRMRAGLWSLSFRNDDDRWNPWNTASPYYGNLLTANQASLETDTTGWAGQPGVTISRSTAQFNDGAASLLMELPAGPGDVAARTTEGTGGVAVVGGLPYWATAWFVAPVTARDCDVSIVWYDSGGSLISLDTGAAVTDSGWTQATVTATAPSTAVYAAVQVRASSAAAGEDHHVDKIAFNGGDPFTSPFGFTWTAGGLGGLLQPMLKMRVKAEWNLLTANAASVETDESGWAVAANCTIDQGVGVYLDGAASLKLTSSAAGDMSADTSGSASSVVVGERYTAVASFISITSARSCRVSLRWINAAGGTIGDTPGSTVVDSGGWQQATVTDIAPAGAVYGRVLATVLATGGAAEVHHVDNAGIFPGNNTVWSAGGPYYLFTGYVESIEHAWPAPTYSETTITLVDGFKVLSMAKAARTTHHDATLALTPDGYWRFNEPGTASTVNGLITAVDDSGNAADGTYKGSPAAFQQPGALPAEIGGCVDLGVRQGLVELPIGACPSGTGDWGVGLWVYLRSFEQVGAVDKIWHVTDVGSQHVEINIQLDGKPRFWVTDGTNGGYLNSDTEVPLFRWFRIDAVKIGTIGPANWKLFIDKVDVSDTTSLDGSGNVSVTANSMLVGGRTSGGVSIAALDGLVDEAAIFPSDTSGDVGDLYDAGYGLAATSLAGARIGKLLDVAGFPAADRSLDAGQYVMQPVKGQLYNNSPLPLILDYVDSEGYPAAFFFDGRGYAIFEDNAHATPSSSATFGDGANVGLYNGAGGDPPVRDDGDLYTTVVCQADDGAAQMATDATAAARFVDRTLSKTGLKNADDADVATLATDTLARVSTTGERIKGLTVHPVGDPGTLWPLALGLDIQDRIGYERATFPGGGSGMDLDLRIEGVEHDIRVDDWFVTFMAVPL